MILLHIKVSEQLENSRSIIYDSSRFSELFWEKEITSCSTFTQDGLMYFGVILEGNKFHLTADLQRLIHPSTHPHMSIMCQILET